MAGKTNSEHILDLLRRTEQIGTKQEERSEQFEKADKQQQADINALETKIEALPQRVATLEQRCAALEKHADRTWQVWLALIVAGIGLAVSLLKK